MGSVRVSCVTLEDSMNPLATSVFASEICQPCVVQWKSNRSNRAPLGVLFVCRSSLNTDRKFLGNRRQRRKVSPLAVRRVQTACAVAGHALLDLPLIRAPRLGPAVRWRLEHAPEDKAKRAPPIQVRRRSRSAPWSHRATKIAPKCR